jgi:hypothetical protein
MSPSSLIRPIRSACLLSFALLSLIGASACKPVDDPDDDDDLPATPIESDDAAEVLAQQICADVFACECPNLVGYADEPSCIVVETDDIAARIDATLAAGGSWDPECAGQMAKTMRDWDCLGPTMAAWESTYSPLTCPVLKGVLGLNEYCNRNSLGDDCQAGLMCLDGMCAEAPSLPVALGQECGWDDLPCESGSYCDWDLNYENRICRTIPQAGDTCVQEQYLCGPSSNDLVCELGTCTAAPAEGESCEMFNLCAPGFYCDGGQDCTCQPRQELGEGCGADTVCPVDASCVMNLCEADPAVVCNATNLF